MKQSCAVRWHRVQHERHSNEKIFEKVYFTLSSTVFSKKGVCFSLHIFVFCTCACIVYVRHFCSATSCSQTAWMVHQRRQQNCISMCQLFRLFRVTAITKSWTVQNVRRIHDLLNCMTGYVSDRRVQTEFGTNLIKQISQFVHQSFRTHFYPN